MENNKMIIDCALDCRDILGKSYYHSHRNTLITCNLFLGDEDECLKMKPLHSVEYTHQRPPQGLIRSQWPTIYLSHKVSKRNRETKLGK